MSPGNALDADIKSVLRDLDAIRGRLDQASEWLADGKKTISAAALAGEIRSLCVQASKAEEIKTARSLILEAEKLIQELNALLGAH